MALTRGMLKGMGLTEEQIGAIIDEHVATIDGLKTERDKFKTEIDGLAGVQQELEEAKKRLASSDPAEWESKYNKEHTDFEAYKAQIAEDQREAECKSLYRNLLLENGVGTKHIDSILRVTDFKSIKKGKDGKLENTDKLTENIKTEWAGFIASTSAQGAGVENPPTTGNAMTKEAFNQLSLAEQMKYANEHPNEIKSLI